MAPRSLLLAVALAHAPMLAHAASDTLLVASRFTDEVLAFDLATGVSLGVFVGAGLDNPVGLTFGPDGHLYVASADDDRIARFDGATGAPLGDVTAGAPLDGPRDLAFGPDGTLFVGNAATNEVLCYEPSTGALLGRYGAAGLDGPTGLTFDADGYLWIAGVLSNSLHRFDVATGAQLELRTHALLRGPHDLALGPDGWIYVTNAFAGSARVVKFDPAPQGQLAVHAQASTLVSPLGMQWTSDGALLVANQGRDEVVAFGPATPPVATTLVPSGTGGLDGPLFLALVPRIGGPRLVPPPPGTAGTDVWFVCEGMTPGANVRAWYGLGVASPGPVVSPTCPLLRLELTAPRLFVVRPADGSGLALVRRTLPVALAGTTLVMQAADLGACRVSPLVRLTP
jgi:sugar lactone lactonase YvrE